MKRITLLLAVIALCAACDDTGVPGPVSAPSPSHQSANDPGSKIVFATDRDGPDPVGNAGNQEIYVMNPDGTNQTRLTNNPAIDGAPSWSPNGRKIVFHSTRENPGPPARAIDIYIMDADGSDQTQLTHLTAMRLGALDPAWSPTGHQVVFSTQLEPREIYVINVDGSGLTNLTNHPARDADPDWSPNGAFIAFTSSRDGNREIYVMNADGSEPVRLTVAPGTDERPAWSPNGQQLAFNSNRDGNQEIYVMDADGSDPVRLTFDPAEDVRAGWSPDGQFIVFDRRVDTGHFEVFVMNADGTNQTRLTTSGPDGFSGFGSWGAGALFSPRRPDISGDD